MSFSIRRAALTSLCIGFVAALAPIACSSKTPRPRVASADAAPTRHAPMATATTASASRVASPQQLHCPGQTCGADGRCTSSASGGTGGTSTGGKLQRRNGGRHPNHRQWDSGRRRRARPRRRVRHGQRRGDAHPREHVRHVRPLGLDAHRRSADALGQRRDGAHDVLPGSRRGRSRGRAAILPPRSARRRLHQQQHDRLPLCRLRRAARAADGRSVDGACRSLPQTRRPRTRTRQPSSPRSRRRCR